MSKIFIAALGLPGDGQEQERAWDLMPVGDRPWIHHQLEQLIGCGQKELVFILYHEPTSIQKYLGDGERWGVTIRYRLASDPKQPLACLRGMDLEGPVLVGSSLVLTPVEWLESESAVAVRGPEQEPLPWLRLTPEELRRSARCDWPELMTLYQSPAVTASQSFKLRDGRDLLARNQDFLHRRLPLPPLAREVEPGCWIGRDVVLHPTVKVIAPCSIGPHCRVGRLAQIGPGAVIGAGSILDDKCLVVNSVVTPGTYLGPGLELQEMTAEPGLLHLSDGDVVTVPDTSLLGYTRPAFRWRKWLWYRLLAWFCLLALTPWRWLAGRGGQGAEYVTGGLAEDPGSWRKRTLQGWGRGGLSLRQHFWQVFLPALPVCAGGQLALVGCTPLSVEDLSACGMHSRRRYVRRGPGLISEALVQFGSQASQEERELADAYQALQGEGLYPLALLGKYLLGVLADAPHNR